MNCDSLHHFYPDVFKLGEERSNESFMRITNVLLLLNLIIGFFWNSEGSLFSEMFRTNRLMVLEKNFLNWPC
jgi:NADH-quinone oxidoreductase subunit N